MRKFILVLVLTVICVNCTKEANHHNVKLGYYHNPLRSRVKLSIGNGYKAVPINSVKEYGLKPNSRLNVKEATLLDDEDEYKKIHSIQHLPKPLFVPISGSGSGDGDFKENEEKKAEFKTEYEEHFSGSGDGNGNNLSGDKFGITYKLVDEKKKNDVYEDDDDILFDHDVGFK